jgi:hypothetical protein
VVDWWYNQKVATSKKIGTNEWMESCLPR